MQGKSLTRCTLFSNIVLIRTLQGHIWISTSLPHPVSSPEFPNAPPRELWDSVLASLRTHRSQFVSTGFTGPLGVGSATKVSEKDIELYERIFDSADGLAIERAVQIYTSANLTEQLTEFSKSSNTPLLLIHGGADGGVPFEASAGRVKQLVPRAQVVTYENGGHGLLTHPRCVARLD
jgi:pimeloyl-ACP methyl ester carboxylesterase